MNRNNDLNVTSDIARLNQEMHRNEETGEGNSHRTANDDAEYKNEEENNNGDSDTGKDHDVMFPKRKNRQCRDQNWKTNGPARNRGFGEWMVMDGIDFDNNSHQPKNSTFGNSENSNSINHDAIGEDTKAATSLDTTPSTALQNHDLQSPLSLSRVNNKLTSFAEEEVVGMVAAPKYKKGQLILYKSHCQGRSAEEEACILDVHADDLLEPYYTIRLVNNGKEKQTDNDHIILRSDNGVDNNGIDPQELMHTIYEKDEPQPHQQKQPNEQQKNDAKNYHQQRDDEFLSKVESHLDSSQQKYGSRDSYNIQLVPKIKSPATYSLSNRDHTSIYKNISTDLNKPVQQIDSSGNPSMAQSSYINFQNKLPSHSPANDGDANNSTRHNDSWILQKVMHRYNSWKHRIENVRDKLQHRNVENVAIVTPENESDGLSDNALLFSSFTNTTSAHTSETRRGKRERAINMSHSPSVATNNDIPGRSNRIDLQFCRSHLSPLEEWSKKNEFYEEEKEAIEKMGVLPRVHINSGIDNGDLSTLIVPGSAKQRSQHDHGEKCDNGSTTATRKRTFSQYSNDEACIDEPSRKRARKIVDLPNSCKIKREGGHVICKSKQTTKNKIHRHRFRRQPINSKNQIPRYRPFRRLMSSRSPISSRRSFQFEMPLLENRTTEVSYQQLKSLSIASHVLRDCQNKLIGGGNKHYTVPTARTFDEEAALLCDVNAISSFPCRARENPLFVRKKTKKSKINKCRTPNGVNQESKERGDRFESSIKADDPIDASTEKEVLCKMCQSSLAEDKERLAATNIPNSSFESDSSSEKPDPTEVEAGVCPNKTPSTSNETIPNSTSKFSLPYNFMHGQANSKSSTPSASAGNYLSPDMVNRTFPANYYPSNFIHRECNSSPYYPMYDYIPRPNASLKFTTRNPFFNYASNLASDYCDQPNLSHSSMFIRPPVNYAAPFQSTSSIPPFNFMPGAVAVSSNQPSVHDVANTENASDASFCGDIVSAVKCYVPAVMKYVFNLFANIYMPLVPPASKSSPESNILPSPDSNPTTSTSQSSPINRTASQSSVSSLPTSNTLPRECGNSNISCRPVAYYNTCSAISEKDALPYKFTFPKADLAKSASSSTNEKTKAQMGHPSGLKPVIVPIPEGWTCKGCNFKYEKEDTSCYICESLGTFEEFDEIGILDTDISARDDATASSNKPGSICTFTAPGIDRNVPEEIGNVNQGSTYNCIGLSIHADAYTAEHCPPVLEHAGNTSNSALVAASAAAAGECSKKRNNNEDDNDFNHAAKVTRKLPATSILEPSSSFESDVAMETESVCSDSIMSVSEYITTS